MSVENEIGKVEFAEARGISKGENIEPIAFQDESNDLDKEIKAGRDALHERSLTEDDFESWEEKHRLGKLELVELEARRSEMEAKLEVEQDPLADLTVADYDRLHQSGIIDISFLNSLKQLRMVTDGLQAEEFPTTSARLQLMRLLKKQGKYHQEVQVKIDQRREEVAKEQGNFREAELSTLKARIKTLEEMIELVENDPGFQKRMAEKKEQERKAYDIEKNREQTRLTEAANRYIDSISRRHKSAFMRIAEVVGDKDVEQKMIDMSHSTDRNEQIDFFDRLRTLLIRSILMAIGDKQIKSLSEVVPWRMVDGTHYGDAQSFLKEFVLVADSTIIDKDLFDRTRYLETENLALRMLYGPKKFFDRKDGKEKDGQFWLAFDRRKETDANGYSEFLLAQQKRDQEYNIRIEEEIRELVERGGFVVETPIYDIVPGKRDAVVIVGTKRGAVLLEKMKSKKGQEMWKVLESAGMTKGLGLGSVSTLDMRAFPEYVRDAAKYAFARDAKTGDFAERLIYEEE